ncbi:MAG: hypothetical protein IPN49_14195 [Saprospiraceae bacterium]|nr:hypothetical protein [Saprospiraceae bacterium]
MEVEPPKNPHPVIFHNHCMVTPHIAWAGLGARQKLLEGIVDNIANFIEGKWVNRFIDSIMIKIIFMTIV